jgi:hypothetical protein
MKHLKLNFLCCVRKTGTNDPAASSLHSSDVDLAPRPANNLPSPIEHQGAAIESITVSKTEPIAHFPLFSELPTELRLKIYQYALYPEDRDGFYDLTKGGGIPEPPLLFTSKTIRKEAIVIFYRKNRFKLMMPSWDPAAEVLIMRKEKMLANGEITERRQYTPQGGGPQWKNLLEWLRRYHAGEAHALAAPAVKVYEDEDVGESIPEQHGCLSSMFKLVAALSGSLWGEVEPIIQGLRHGLNAMDSDWRID